MHMSFPIHSQILTLFTTVRSDYYIKQFAQWSPLPKLSVVQWQHEHWCLIVWSPVCFIRNSSRSQKYGIKGSCPQMIHFHCKSCHKIESGITSYSKPKEFWRNAKVMNLKILFCYKKSYNIFISPVSTVIVLYIYQNITSNWFVMNIYLYIQFITWFLKLVHKQRIGEEKWWPHINLCPFTYTHCDLKRLWGMGIILISPLNIGFQVAMSHDLIAQSHTCIKHGFHVRVTSLGSTY